MPQANLNPFTTFARIPAACLAAMLPLAAAAQTCTSATPTPQTEIWAPATMTSGAAHITIYTAPTDHMGQLQIANGIGKSLWVGMAVNSTVLKLTTKGHATIYPTPTAHAGPEGMTQTGKTMTFSEFTTPCTATITAHGKITEHATTLSQTNSTNMITGSDGAAWFVTDYNGIGRVSKTGVTKFYTFADQTNQPTGIGLGPDGNVWFIENQGNYIGKVTPKGKITEYNANFGGGSYSFGITGGSDGRVWFADAHNNRIGAIHTDGTGLTYYATGLTGQPISITSGSDGNLYFGETTPVIGRITPAGVITEFPFTASLGVFKILSLTTGPDKNIWFANNPHSQVGMLKLPIK